MDYQKLFSVIPKEPRRWTQGDVESWLEFIGLQDLSDVFCINLKILYNRKKCY